MVDVSETDDPGGPYFLPYRELCARLRRVRASFGLRRVLSTRTLEGETKTFAEILDGEVEKIVLSFMSRCVGAIILA